MPQNTNFDFKGFTGPAGAVLNPTEKKENSPKEGDGSKPRKSKKDRTLEQRRLKEEKRNQRAMKTAQRLIDSGKDASGQVNKRVRDAYDQLKSQPAAQATPEITHAPTPALQKAPAAQPAAQGGVNGPNAQAASQSGGNPFAGVAGKAGPNTQGGEKGYRTDRVPMRNTDLSYLRTPAETLARIRDGQMALQIARNTNPMANAQAAVAQHKLLRGDKVGADGNFVQPNSATPPTIQQQGTPPQILEPGTSPTQQPPPSTPGVGPYGAGPRPAVQPQFPDPAGMGIERTAANLKDAPGNDLFNPNPFDKYSQPADTGQSQLGPKFDPALDPALDLGQPPAPGPVSQKPGFESFESLQNDPASTRGIEHFPEVAGGPPVPGTSQQFPVPGTDGPGPSADPSGIPVPGTRPASPIPGTKTPAPIGKRLNPIKKKALEASKTARTV